jgi:hypothetical protein
MIAKRIGILLVGVTLLASAAYVFVYLQRWEWNRALIAGVFMLASELVLVAAVLAGRIRSVERKVTALSETGPHDRVLRRLREAPAEQRDHFAWLRPTGTGNAVFVPVLMGAGLVLSALAWVVERLAKATAGPTLERSLATQLVGLSVPEEPLVEPDVDPLALGTHAILLRPHARSAP